MPEVDGAMAVERASFSLKVVRHVLELFRPMPEGVEDRAAVVSFSSVGEMSS
jgi:hypothetical protein